jgi:cellulose synthase/poly-beta-1,6-N-acetylglucosamine synthase-like glycosyltransferase
VFPIALPVLWILAIPAAGSSLYLLALTALSARPKAWPRSSRSTRFDIIIPAHNEEGGIAAAVRSALAVDWPRDRFRVLVVADNCTDATAEVAARAGAEVLIRQNDSLRGKGYALAHAFAESRKNGRADAVAIIDADSRVSSNLLEAFAARMERGEQAVQVHYGVSNVHAAWRTRLMAIALAAFHRVRSRGRERIGASCGIRGNGWALTHALLERVPYASFSLVEDLEFGIELGLRGIRVAYADEADCDGEMVSGEKAARSQRRRWEQGRTMVVRSSLLPLLKRAFTAPSLVCLDLAMDLIVPPLSYCVLSAAALAAAGWLFAKLGGGGSAWAWTGALSCVALLIYVLRGWQLSRTGWRGLLDLLRAPFFLAWKLVVILRGRRTGEWVRTNREGS